MQPHLSDIVSSSAIIGSVGSSDEDRILNHSTAREHKLTPNMITCLLHSRISCMNRHKQCWRGLKPPTRHDSTNCRGSPLQRMHCIRGSLEEIGVCQVRVSWVSTGWEGLEGSIGYDFYTSWCMMCIMS